MICVSFPARIAKRSEGSKGVKIARSDFSPEQPIPPSLLRSYGGQATARVPCRSPKGEGRSAPQNICLAIASSVAPQ
jgi:hypothetical protein